MIIFLYGEDSFRSREKLRELKDKFQKEVDPAGSSLNTIDGEKATMEKINEIIAAPSLFARRRMVVIENIFSGKSSQFLDDVLSYFKKKEKDSGNIVVFWDDLPSSKMKKAKLFGYLAGQKFSQEFALLSGAAVTNWIKDRASRMGLEMEGAAATRLSAFCGSNLWQASNELDKMASYSKAIGAKLISKETADLFCQSRLEENIFAFTDAVSQKRKAAALGFLETEIEAGAAEQYVLFMLVRHFKILSQVKQALDSGDSPKEISSALKLHPFVVQKSVAQARNFTLKDLKAMVGELTSLDGRLKSGRADFRLAVGLLIAK